MEKHHQNASSPAGNTISFLQTLPWKRGVEVSGERSLLWDWMVGFTELLSLCFEEDVSRARWVTAELHEVFHFLLQWIPRFGCKKVAWWEAVKGPKEPWVGHLAHSAVQVIAMGKIQTNVSQGEYPWIFIELQQTLVGCYPWSRCLSVAAGQILVRVHSNLQMKAAEKVVVQMTNVTEQCLKGESTRKAEHCTAENILQEISSTVVLFSGYGPCVFWA